MSEDEPKTRMGRPEFKATNAMRQKVMLFKAAGMADDDIGRAIGCSDVTLRKHFAEELRTGRVKKLGENLLRLERAAKKGNVTAAKYLDQKMRLPTDDEFARQGEQPKGKKEERAEQARAAGQGSDWADDLSYEPSAVN